MSLLSIVKSVMDSNGWPAVTASVAASTDQNMRQCLALANSSLSSVSYKKNWPVLIREHSFTTVGGQEAYPLPADFHHLVSPSAVNSDQYYQLKGSLTPIQWYRYVFNGGISWTDGFMLDAFGKTFKVTPLPTAAESITFMYITSNIAKTADGTPTTRYTQDTDMSLVDEDIIELGLTWRWRQKKGLDFTAELAEYNGTLNQRFAQSLGTGELPIGRVLPYGDWPLTQPDTGNWLPGWGGGS
jgi:hypothetical protein